MSSVQIGVREKELPRFRIASDSPAKGLSGSRMDVNKTVKLSNRDRNILLRAPLIGIADDAAALKLMEAATITNVNARHVLFKEGEAAQHFYCVLSGYIRLYRLDRHGREADVRVSGPGDTFNECLIFGSDTYRYSAQAAESCTVARFELTRIRSLIDQEPAIAKAVMRCLSNSLLATMDCIANDRLQTAPQRVAHYLINQGPRDATSFHCGCRSRKACLPASLALHRKRSHAPSRH